MGTHTGHPEVTPRSRCEWGERRGGDEGGLGWGVPLVGTPDSSTLGSFSPRDPGLYFTQPPPVSHPNSLPSRARIQGSSTTPTHSPGTLPVGPNLCTTRTPAQVTRDPPHHTSRVSGDRTRPRLKMSVGQSGRPRAGGEGIVGPVTDTDVGTGHHVGTGYRRTS